MRAATGFRRPWAFWFGVAALTAGVALHLPMYLGAKDMHYLLSGMPMDGWMYFGMALMVAGYGAVLYGLAPRFSTPAAETQAPDFEAMDSSRLTAAHIRLMLILMVAVAVDTLKPFTFTFILPGVANEYDLQSPSHLAPGHWPVALFPFAGILGTFIGSLVWGRLGDSIGRRASILLAAALFIGTSMCGAMPAFHWNLVACFVMGLSAGGLLPIAYSLLAETIPAKRRGEAVVLVAGLGTALGFLLASWSAHWLIPTYSWRVMWFLGVPTGLLLIVLNRYLPESPRFLLANGHADEARAVMRSFGLVVKEREAPAPAERPVAPGFASVFRRPYTAISIVLVVYGLAWGLVNYGFLVWLPVYVAKTGVGAGQVTTVLAKAALFAVPGSVLVAWLYGRWSSRGTLAVAGVVEAGVLVVFAAEPSIVHRTGLFTVLLVLLLIALWATVSALAPYAAEIYPTAIRGAGSGVVAGATKLGGVLVLALAVMSWAPPGVTGAAALAAVPAGAAAVLLLFYGVETRGKRLEEITRSETEPRKPWRPVVRFRGSEYPVIFPSWKDPRLHLSLTFVCLHTLGQIEFHFRLSIPQILTALLSCAIIEVVVTFRQKRVLLWPASALLTGNGIAFIMRIPGTQHGDWWSTNGLWIYAAVGAVSMASKYLITWRGRHVFNPSNLGLVLCFLILGSTRAEPLQFWWGPMSPALFIVLGTIVAGGLLILSRVGQLWTAVLFWVTFTLGTGILAASGHGFTANWHLGPVENFYFWRVLVTSPEVFIFMNFMITDPKTAPESVRGRKLYAIAIGLLSSVLIAPMTTEFQAKVALLGTLTIVCAARPLIILGREALERRSWQAPRLRRPVLVAAAALGSAAFAGLVVAAGAPARSLAGIAAPAMGNGVRVTIHSTPGLVTLNRATGNQIAADAVASLQQGSTQDISYHVQSCMLQLQPAVGQAPPTVVATLSGTAGSTRFTRVFDMQLKGAHFVVVHTTSKPAAQEPTTFPKGTPSFAKSVHLVDVASKVGLTFRQDAFRNSLTDDPQAMMGGGVCWLDYNNDGWLDLYAVNSYNDGDLPYWQAHGGLPQSQLFENEHGRFVNVTKPSHTGLRVKGTGCAAADLNGDGRDDLVVTTATGIDLLWNDGNGTFTQAASSSGISPPYAWYSSISVADVNGDGRPDIFVGGYTNLLDRIQSSIAGFPTNYQGVRDLLYLNEGNGPNGRARFKEAGVQAGLESAHLSHALGSTFTDVNGDGRPDLYVANDSDPNMLYLNEPGGPLGFHFVSAGASYGVADPNAGMGVAEGDYNGDGRPDLFITNSRGQPHAAYESGTAKDGETTYAPESAKFAKALDRHQTVGWGDAWIDLDNTSKLDLVLTNGSIPILNLKTDRQPMQVLQDLGDAQFRNASGVIDQASMPKIIGRGLAVADFDNDGREDVAVNSIDGPLVLLRNESAAGNWLEVSLKGFHPGAVVTAQLPDGTKLVDELHAGSSYLSSEDPRAHFGLGKATKVATLTIRYPNGTVRVLHDVRANRILDVP
ncbi:MAG TPA: MFS transporter [Gaiellaceae bacterium]|nr:MFS transporter [Gaiellaceae bacterium]